MSPGDVRKIDDVCRRMYDRFERLPGVRGAITFVVGEGTHIHGHVSGRPEYAAMLEALSQLFFVELSDRVSTRAKSGFRVGECPSRSEGGGRSAAGD